MEDDDSSDCPPESLDREFLLLSACTCVLGCTGKTPAYTGPEEETKNVLHVRTLRPTWCSACTLELTWCSACTLELTWSSAYTLELTWCSACTLRPTWSSACTLELTWCSVCTLELTWCSACTLELTWSSACTLELTWCSACTLELTWSYLHCTCVHGESAQRLLDQPNIHITVSTRCPLTLIFTCNAFSMATNQEGVQSADLTN